MPSRLEMIALGLMVVIAAAVVVAVSPNSYAHVFLTGRCFKEPMPAACHARSVGRAGIAGHGVSP
ncbi:MAG TPA: hypothetical protein VHZ32_16780 [Rhizomicrobium sp.]|jgi:hypothetical protein|nr:hypothetical protein [Rhizomicrobium sp.]